MKNPILTSTWEKKMQDKAARQHYKDVKQVAIDARKQKLQVRICKNCSLCCTASAIAQHAIWHSAGQSAVGDVVICCAWDACMALHLCLASRKG